MANAPLPRPCLSPARPLAVALTCVALCACGDNRTHPAEHAAYTSGTDVPLSCVPNLDGRLDPDEIGFAVGVPIRYLVSPAGETRKVDLAGQLSKGGQRIWDWSTEVASDQEAKIAAGDLAGTWFADAFAGGQYVAPIDVGGEVLGVYVKDDAAVWLLGLASAEEKPAAGKTLVVYDQPIALYRFPIEPGQTWSTSASVTNATLRGLPYAGKDTYDAKVVAAGTLILPPIEFTQAHEIVLTATIEPAVGASVRTRQASFLFECFGEVARATSKTDETEEMFTTAAELRRLGL